MWMYARMFVVSMVSVTTMVSTGAAQELPYSEADVFFELNNTDGDLGIHASIDGRGWRDLIIEAPVTSANLLDISVKGRLRMQGLTQLMFESTEPPFDELAPAVFFERFPEGVYEVTGMSVEGIRMRSNSVLTHAMPAAPSNLRVNGLPLPTACGEGPSPSVSSDGDILIEWDPVETTHESLGSPQGSPDIEIELYEVFIDQDSFGLSVERDPENTELLIPAGTLEPGETLVEVLVREDSHNQTASETCFDVE